MNEHTQLISSKSLTSSGGIELNKCNGKEEVDSNAHLPVLLRSSVSWLPIETEADHERSLKRRLFLLLTEPKESKLSLLFFVVLIVSISVINILMFMETMNVFQFIPDDCVSCGGTASYTFEDDSVLSQDFDRGSINCECPPAPQTWILDWEAYIVYFFTVEWILRVLAYEPKHYSSYKHSYQCIFKTWISFVFKTSQVLDFLAIFPYYLEDLDHTRGLMSLRLLRLFRVFQLVRLGQYGRTFNILCNVLFKSITYLKILIVVLLFGAAFFGSMIYWFEKGSWMYNEELDSFMFMRLSVDGISYEPSPFQSIPVSFWWFMVTATTVGYGDMYPTSTNGKFIATLTMLTGVLVIAFPVSVFSDLWSSELERSEEDDDDNDDDDSICCTGNCMRSRRNNDNVGKMNTAATASSPSVDASNKGLLPKTLQIPVDELETIQHHMKRIDESQTELKKILQKYKVS